jgi:membrane associated rhomboid family serine protease
VPLRFACPNWERLALDSAEPVPSGATQPQIMPAEVIPFPKPNGSKPSAPKPPPAINVPTVVLVVLGILLAVHVLLWLAGEEWQVWSIYALSFVPARFGGEDVAFPEGAQWWSFLTYGLLHADAYHIGSNLLWLLIFSTPIARRWPAWKYLFLLVVAAIAGAAAMLVTQWGKAIPVVGASAAVSATLSAMIPIVFGPDYRLKGNELLDHRKLRVLSFGALMRNTQALAFMALFLAMTLFTGASQVVSQTAFVGENSIAWEAHLAGFIVGLALFYLLDGNRLPAAQNR